VFVAASAAAPVAAAGSSLFSGRIAHTRNLIISLCFNWSPHRTLPVKSSQDLAILKAKGTALQMISTYIMDNARVSMPHW